MVSKNIVQKIVVAGIIIKDHKVLVIQRTADEESFPNLWELPSGKREFLETSHDALIREIKEETNINVKVVMPVSTFEYSVEKEDGIRDTTQINFLAEFIGGEVKLSNEHQNFAWITEDELKNYKVSKTVKEAIIKAFKISK